MASAFIPRHGLHRLANIRSEAARTCNSRKKKGRNTRKSMSRLFFSPSLPQPHGGRGCLVSERVQDQALQACQRQCQRRCHRCRSRKTARIADIECTYNTITRRENSTRCWPDRTGITAWPSMTGGERQDRPRDQIASISTPNIFRTFHANVLPPIAYSVRSTIAAAVP